MARSNKSYSKNKINDFVRLRLHRPAKMAGVILEQPCPERENAKLSQLCICTNLHAGYFLAWPSISWSLTRIASLEHKGRIGIDCCCCRHPAVIDGNTRDTSMHVRPLLLSHLSLSYLKVSTLVAPKASSLESKRVA